MYILLSPAKSLNESSEIVCPIATEPIFYSEKQPVVDKLKKLTVSKIEKTFKLSQKLAELNHHRYQMLGSEENVKKSRQAIFTFDGDVYVGFDAYGLDQSKYEYAQNTIRILSGLYGVLKPFDLIEPYRLEMGTSLTIGKKKNLYEFWSDRVTKSLEGPSLIVNLASNEYSKVVQFKKINAEVLNVDFLERDKGENKNISFYSKKARGMMARYIIDHHLTSKEELKNFDTDRYEFDERLSTASHYVFTRDFQPIGKKIRENNTN